ncbi:hypothetical protein ACOMHN_018712 [Nucella lapillus]
MTVCEQGVQLTLHDHDHPTHPACPAPDHPPSHHPLPCSGEGALHGNLAAAEAFQGAALDPLSPPPPHPDSPGHHDLPHLSAHGPLPERESGQLNGRSSSATPSRGGESPGGVVLPEAVVAREGESEASTSSSEASCGRSSVPSRTDQESERREKGEVKCGSRQKNPSVVDSLPRPPLLPGAVVVHCRDAQVQTMSGSTLSPSHFLPHVDTACQTSPQDSGPSVGSPSREHLAVKSADVSTQQPEVAETPRTEPETANHVTRQEDVSHVISDSPVPERRTACCTSGNVLDQQNGKLAGHFGTSNEVNRTDSSSENKKRTSDRNVGKSQKQQNKGKSEQPTAKTSGHKGEDNQSRQFKSKRGDESQSKQCAQRQRDSYTGQSKADRKHTNQRDSKMGQSNADQKQTTTHQRHESPKPSKRSSIKRTPSSQKKGKENFSFLPEEVPEMQVMVNSLTPVLQRRKSARRSNSHTRASSSEDITSGCEDLQSMLASFTAPSPQQPRPKHTHLPEDYNQGLSPASSKLSSQRPPVMDEASGDRTSTNLFIRPKYARTWHGPMQTGTRRAAAPRMGVTMMNSDPSSLTLGPSGARGQGYSTHVHTLPVISRTLLDALHKRYCGYQYSSGGSWVPSLLPFPPLAANARPTETHPPHPLLLPATVCPMVPGVPAPKLNSEGESDTTGSGSPGTSSESSPRTGHSQPPAALPTTSVASTTASAVAASSSTASLQKHNAGGQTKKEEIEAVEACQWLRAAGFPQYAQMFEDGLFPVDISDVQRDHDFLDSDSIQSVIRQQGQRPGGPHCQGSRDRDLEDHHCQGNRERDLEDRTVKDRDLEDRDCQGSRDRDLEDHHCQGSRDRDLEDRDCLGSRDRDLDDRDYQGSRDRDLEDRDCQGSRDTWRTVTVKAAGTETWRTITVKAAGTETWRTITVKAARTETWKTVTVKAAGTETWRTVTVKAAGTETWKTVTVKAAGTETWRTITVKAAGTETWRTVTALLKCFWTLGTENCAALGFFDHRHACWANRVVSRVKACAPFHPF